MRVSLATQMRGTYAGTDLAAVSAGLLYDERQARSTADSSEVTARQSLSAKLTGANDPTSLTLNTLASGLLYDEREARVTAVSSEANSRVSLATQMRGAYAGTNLAAVSAGLLYDERQARSTADSSEVTARQSLSAKLTGANDPTSLTLNTLASGLLYDEREARVTAVSSEANSRVSLATQMRGAYAGTNLAAVSAGLLYDERQARSTADSSEVTARQSLSAVLTGVNDPTGQTLGSLSSGLLYEERQARASAVSAEADSRSLLEARVVSPTIGNNPTYAAVLTEASVRAGETGNLNAQYVLKVGATRSDGRKVFSMVGLGATLPTDGTGGQSEIIMMGGRLVFVPSDNVNADPANVFEVGTVNGVTTLTVPAARIGDLTVGTKAITNNATSKLLGSTVFFSSIAWVTVHITSADIPSGASTVQAVVWAGTDGHSVNPYLDVGVFAGTEASPPTPDFTSVGSLMSSQPPAGDNSMVFVLDFGVGVYTVGCWNRGSGATPAYEYYTRIRTVTVLVVKK